MSHGHDPQVLRAIAHPVRNRILDELEAQGPMRAADVARELGIPANQASFHLRQLAKYGVVQEDPAAARDRRDRVWRVVDPDSLTIDLSAMEQARGGRAAAAVFRRHAASWGHLVVDRVLTGERLPGEHRSVTERALRLTAEEARRLTAELDRVVAEWAERNRGRHSAAGDAPRETYLYYGAVLPHPGLPERPI